jgi:hypothetical protein
MAPRAEIGYLVGYVASNIWRIWFPHLDTVREVRDVVFDENVQYHPDIAENPIGRDVRHTMPWSVPDYSESDEYMGAPPVNSTVTETTEPPVVIPPVASQGDKSKDEQVDPLLTPSTTPSRDNTPVPTGSALPGAFPADSAPQITSNRLEPEGVRGREDQLQDELQGTVSPISSNPPPGYRLRGDLAPRDISLTVSEDNIVSGSRVRKKKVYFASASAEEEHFSEDPEESHRGVLLAFTTAISSPQPYQRPHRDDLPPEPKNWMDMLRHPHVDGFTEAAIFEVKSLEAKGTFEEIDRPTDVSKQVLPLKWVFTYKFDSDGFLIKYKARICVRGDLQVMTTEEKYSATLAVRTARMIFALAAAFDLDTAQLDAVNAFLNSTLPDEVYVELPPGLFPKHKRLRCWKLIKALYGLRKSPRLWQQEASRVLIILGFKVVHEDACLFVSDDGIIVIFYVDDIIIFSPRFMRDRAAAVAARLAEAWELRAMGEAQWFLGIRIVRDRQKGAVWLCQDAYISSMATRYHLTEERKLECPPVSIGDLKAYDGVATNEHKHEFSQKVGSAQYATTITRVESAKPVAYLAQFLSNPSPEHLHAINQIISYMYQTRFKAICYRVPTELTDQAILQFFSDASYGDNHDRKSSAGFICMAFGGPIDWKASKQKTVTTSTTEAELLAMSEAGKSMCMWTRLFKAIMFDPGHPVYLQCDNQQTVSLLLKESPQLRTKLRHIDIHQHWLRQEVQAGRITVKWVKTTEMVADGLTKLLPRLKHAEFVRMLGLEDIGHLLAGLN